MLNNSAQLHHLNNFIEPTFGFQCVVLRPRSKGAFSESSSIMRHSSSWLTENKQSNQKVHCCSELYLSLRGSKTALWWVFYFCFVLYMCSRWLKLSRKRKCIVYSIIYKQCSIYNITKGKCYCKLLLLLLFWTVIHFVYHLLLGISLLLLWCKTLVSNFLITRRLIFSFC